MAHWEYCLGAAVWSIKLVHDEGSILNGEAESSSFRALQAESEGPRSKIQHPEKIQAPTFKNRR